jgi:hypothetical protein
VIHRSVTFSAHRDGKQSLPKCSARKLKNRMDCRAAAEAEVSTTFRRSSSRSYVTSISALRPPRFGAGARFKGEFGRQA